MNNRDLKKLATLTLKNKDIDEKLAKFAISNLNRRELKLYLFFLKAAISKKTIFVRSNEILTKDLQSKIKKIFTDGDVEFSLDKNIDSGIVVVYNDTIINLTTKNYIKETINQIKNSL
ncbi:MAG: hypothetical protein COU27_00350 [Candidatus Levybacteria bacterium CG10_big_fil_rev_8_21_14_0_10_36_7]|nr:MAG: hypothetical protein COU27_00350 [Candidatus Levybacteria bacterium CG10_big_fil_rev_8_21_14_0_10_36_7]